MRVTYHTIDEGRLSATEIASLRDGTHLAGSAQIVYFSSGLKNVAYIERVFVAPSHRGRGGGRLLLRDIIEHIEQRPCAFTTDGVEGLVSTTIPEKLGETSERIHEIILLCGDELTAWYEELGFAPSSDTAMRRVVARRSHSSLL